MMRAAIEVMEPAAFDQWREQETRGLALRRDTALVDPDSRLRGSDMVIMGRRLAVTEGCFKCHSVDGSPHIGPTWLDLYHRQEKMQDGSTVDAEEGYLTESMMDPAARVVEGFQPVMPSYQGRLAGPEVAALVEYIKSLQSDAVHPGPPEGPAYAPIRGR